MPDKLEIFRPVALRNDGEERVFYENEYIGWAVSKKTGHLSGAFVTNGSGKNLLQSEIGSILAIKGQDGVIRQYHLSKNAISLKMEKDHVAAKYGFQDDEGRALDCVTCLHDIKFGDCGELVYSVTLEVEKPLENVFSWTPLAFNVDGGFDWLGIRDRHSHGVGFWDQNPMYWKQLSSGKHFTGCQPCLSCSIPLSLLFLRSACEALQLELEDKLENWDKYPDYQECAVLYDRKDASYLVRIATILAADDICIRENTSSSIRFSLPFVRKQVVPLRRASNLLQFQRDLDNVCPTEEEIASMKEAGYSLLRWHNDSDRYGKGEFWRDAVYPPYSKPLMDKMDATIATAHKHGIKVVPYFSLKEIHPAAKDFDKNALNWARLGNRRRKMSVSKFGSVMCLCSDWAQMRKDTIAQVLANHDFDGIYYDWCCGIECDNPAHGNAPHWDNDALLEHLKWTVASFCEKQPERYLHTTNAISLAVENLATMIITEELGFAETGPEMFTPQVHFLNVAPRQICDMLPKDSTDEQRIQLAMCALLHHATISSTSPLYVDFYKKQEWMDKVISYQKHTAPGEGIVSSDDDMVGFSLYYSKDGSMMLVGANLSNEDKECTCRIALPNRKPLSKTLKLKALSMASICFAE